MTKGKILYSSDGSGKNLVKDQKKVENFEEIIPEQICLKFRIEKKGRGGKDVTVIYEVPYNPPYFKKLLKEIKNHVGGGGAIKDDTLEVQGDHRAKLKNFLEKKGFKTKGA
jgi:translation initiation factor 1